MAHVRHLFVVCVLLLAPAAHAGASPRVDRRLVEQVVAAPLTPTPVVITYRQTPGEGDFAVLRSLGINGGIVLSRLPMVLTRINQAQLDALRSRGEIRSLYANRLLWPLTNASRPFVGVSALRQDREATARNGGLPVSGSGIGVAYVDTGIDATHSDLQLGKNVVQNVLFPLAEAPLNFPADFTPVIALENQPNTDLEGGHGTFGASVTAGLGQASGGFYGGVAPGAKLVGLLAGNDVGLSFFAILQAYDYTLVHQIDYNIRVCNNSFGTTLDDLPYDPDDPIQVATRELHDNNIVVVVAAGNDGNQPDVINPLSIAPWVISVAAGNKDGFGAPAAFSSRGNDNGTGADTSGQPADPAVLPNLRPDITAPGVDVKAARAKSPGLTNTLGTPFDVSTIAPAFLPFYTTSSGTSFATPHVSGVVALMLETNPALTPDDVVTILRQTATPMPFPERVVGAGYVDAHNAVRAAMTFAPVPHPADLAAPPGRIVDVADDQLGTTAHDIREGQFAYDEAARQIIYRLTLSDLSVRAPADRWTISSDFGFTTIFVSASITETGVTRFRYGRITTDPNTGVRNNQTLGTPDFGAINGNEILIRLSIDAVNAAVGSDVLFTTSTTTQALAQVLIGSSVTGGLLLAADTASGSDFKLGEPPPPGILVTPTDGLATTEEGGSAQFTVALNSKPTSLVTVALSSSDTTEGTVSPASLTFTPANWNARQAVTVTGVDDPEVDGDVAYRIVTAPAASNDTGYNGLKGPDVLVINLDNDTTPPPPPASCGGKKFVERLAGSLAPGQSHVDVPLSLRCSSLDARLTYEPANQPVALRLIGPDGQTIATAGPTDDPTEDEGDRGKLRIRLTGLAPGQYSYRISGPVTKGVDFVIKSAQRR
ncbi:MAG: S8 family serine peptidase [Gammaproteobacteria bacterium]